VFHALSERIPTHLLYGRRATPPCNDPLGPAT
jgi:hypothetical protein